MIDYISVIKFTDILEARPVPTHIVIAGISFNEFMRGFK